MKHEDLWIGGDNNCVLYNINDLQNMFEIAIDKDDLLKLDEFLPDCTLRERELIA